MKTPTIAELRPNVERMLREQIVCPPVIDEIVDRWTAMVHAELADCEARGVEPPDYYRDFLEEAGPRSVPTESEVGDE